MKVGFLLSSLDNSELPNSFIKHANKFLSINNDTDIIAFVANYVKPLAYPTFATMMINEAFDYNGNVIATDFNLVAKLSRFPGPQKRYYYLWNLDWINSEYSFEESMSVFHNPKISIIARTDNDKKLIQQCWNCNVKAVIPDCNVRDFIEMIRKDEK